MNHDMGRPEFVAVFLMWAIMMTAMMAPSASPGVLLFARAQSRQTSGSSTVPSVGLFIFGYIAIWLAFSVAADALQIALHRAALLSEGMSITDARLAGATLIAAGVFQFTPLKRACLSQCRSPLGSLMSYWRGGNTGALLMGLRQGFYCLGCCWAEMLVLFVVGVMNITWIVLLAMFVLVEKLSAFGLVASRVGGAAAIVAGFVVLVR